MSRLECEPASIVDPGLVSVPPMGLNTWNHFGLEISEVLVRELAAAMVDRGFLAAGYRYLNLDDGWMAPERDRNDRLVGDPVRFPSGIRRLAEEVHDHGLLFGIYSDCGRLTCGGLPASYGHERIDAETFAACGVDYLKYDFCHVPYEDFPGQSPREVAQVLYRRMAEALRATGRPIVFSMCNWGVGEPWEWARGIAHLWRTTPDIQDRFSSPEGSPRDVVAIVRHNLTLAPYAAPGGFNDPDMLEVGNGGLGPREEWSHFALWCMMAAPLLVGCDVRRVPDETVALLTDPDLLAIDQDPLGRQARVVAEPAGALVLRKELEDGLAVAVFNPTEADATLRLDWPTLVGTDAPVVARECGAGTERLVSETESVTVAPHDTLVWRCRQPESAPGSGPEVGA